MRVIAVQNVLTSAPALTGAVRAGCLAFARPEDTFSTKPENNVIQ
jgi:hypothetical protein